MLGWFTIAYKIGSEPVIHSGGQVLLEFLRTAVRLANTMPCGLWVSAILTSDLIAVVCVMPAPATPSTDSLFRDISFFTVNSNCSLLLTPC